MLDKIVGFFEQFGVNGGYIAALLGAVFFVLVILVIDVPLNRTFGFVFALSPIWLPIALFFLFFEVWMHYVRTHFDHGQGRVSLEIRLPQEIFKSPIAMETMLTQLYQTASPDNHIQTYWDGKHPPVFGLELISTGGNTKFIINAPRKKFKNLIEAQLYAQYPGIEVRELPLDYTSAIPYDPDSFDYFSIHYRKGIASLYPIRTYIDYGLLPGQKEEEKTDPITNMLEMLGSIGPREHVWIQILISVHREENFKTGSLTHEPLWNNEIEEEINKIAARKDSKTKVPAAEGGFPQLTEPERQLIAKLDRMRSKLPFTTNIRTMYIAEKSAFLPGERIGAIITSFAQYNDAGSNGIKISWRTDVDWPWWQDPSGSRRASMKKAELKDYKRRAWTPQTQKDHGFIMTTEELATIFHLPGRVAVTPSLERIPSARGEAPPNLPV